MSSSGTSADGAWDFSGSTVTGLNGYATNSDLSSMQSTIMSWVTLNFQPKA
jgi:hypothetical protein